jgi:hypothetical protein
MIHRVFCQLSAAIIFVIPPAVRAEVGLRVTSLGKLAPGLSRHDEESGSVQKWSKVRQLLGERTLP